MREFVIKVALPDGWKATAFRKPELGEYWLDGRGRIRLADGNVNVHVLRRLIITSERA